MKVDHRLNSRRNSKVSAIWEHREEYINMADPDALHRWFCKRCNVSIRLLEAGTTSNVKRHLKRTHGIKIGRTEALEEAETEVEKEVKELNLSLIISYLNKVDIERFRTLLIQWLV